MNLCWQALLNRCPPPPTPHCCNNSVTLEEKQAGNPRPSYYKHFKSKMKAIDAFGPGLNSPEPSSVAGVFREMALWAEPPTGVDFWPCHRRQGSSFFSDQLAQIKNGHKQMVFSLLLLNFYLRDCSFKTKKNKPKRLISADLCDISPLCCGRQARTAEYLHLKQARAEAAVDISPRGRRSGAL